MSTNVNWEGSNYYSNQYQSASGADNVAVSEGPGSLIRRELQRSGMGKKMQLIMDILGSKTTTTTSTTTSGTTNSTGGSQDTSSLTQGMDLPEKLEMLLEVVLSDIDNGIMDKMNTLQQKAQQMEGITQSQAENNPGLTSGLNTESSVLQVQLTMLVNRRQQFVEAVTDSLKSIFDADMNTVRRIV